MQRAYDVGQEIGGVLGRYEHIAVVFFGHLKAFGEGRRAVAYHQSRYIVAHELLKAAAALGLCLELKICALDPAEYLKSFGIEVVIKSGKLKRRTVHVRDR